MPRLWEVVGGVDKGGILVREGQDLKSPATVDRLSTAAVLEEVALIGDRLSYKLVTGTGPVTGWISIKISGKDLAVPKAGTQDQPAPEAEPKEPADWPATLAAALSAPAVASSLKEAAPWVKPVAKLTPQAKIRLVLFTWTGNRGGAGSAHDFRKWEQWLADATTKDTWEVCKVEQPGRGSRVKEPNVTSAREAAVAIADALAKGGSMPGTVLFGFSFGAVLAYETAVVLSARGIPLLGLVVASAEHPSWPGRTAGAGPGGAPTKDMDEASFEDMLRRKGGTDFILREEGMKKMFLPVIRADMVLEEAYGAAPPQHPPLPCPVVAFRGKACPQVSREDAEPWLRCSSCGEGTPTRLEELATGLVPTPAAPWLSDWYLCQGEASAEAMAKAIARDFGGGR